MGAKPTLYLIWGNLYLIINVQNYKLAESIANNPMSPFHIAVEASHFSLCVIPLLIATDVNATFRLS